jgi:competence protein ComEA
MSIFMKKAIYQYLKTYFGFSSRESRGFVLVIPSLAILYLIPTVYETWLNHKHQGVYKEYLVLADSLEKVGWQSITVSDLQFNFQDTSKTKFNTRQTRQVNLNQLEFFDADSILLQVVPGIGPTMAGRIVKFRENAGGLYEREQLMDVFGMTPEVAERVFQYFSFAPQIDRKLNMNQFTVEELARHPYINYGSAKVIVAFREQHGNFESPQDLLKIKIFNQDWLDRLVPYLEF